MILSQAEHPIFRVATRRRKLVLVCFDLPNKCWHFFNQFIGYRAAAEDLGLTPIVLGPRALDPSIAERLAARPVLDSLRNFNLDDVQTITDQLADFFDMASGVQSSWLAIEAENLSRHDIILFSTSHPILIQSTGLWLARRPAEQRPSIFFRFGDATLVDRRTGKTRGAATLYRAASKDLCTCPGHERVFFIGNSQGTVRAVTRVCHRRTFLMPLPKHYGDFSTIPVRPDVPTVYLHFNFRSGQLAHGASEIIRRVKVADPKVQFVVKFSRGCDAGAGTVDDDIASGVELIAAEQDIEDYLRNFAKSSIVVLAYEAEAGGTFTSGAMSR